MFSWALSGATGVRLSRCGGRAEKGRGVSCTVATHDRRACEPLGDAPWVLLVDLQALEDFGEGEGQEKGVRGFVANVSSSPSTGGADQGNFG